MGLLRCSFAGFYENFVRLRLRTTYYIAVHWYLFIVNLLSLLDVRPSRIWPVLPQLQLRPHQHPPQQSLLPLQQHQQRPATQQPQQARLQLLQLLVFKCLLLLRVLWQLWRPHFPPQPPSPQKTKHRATAAGPVGKCKRATAKAKRSLSWKLAHGPR
jgi:hypothetical protein